MPDKGLDEFRRKLEQIKQVSLGELFNPEFMAANTDFQSVGEMFERSGFKCDSLEDVEAIPDEEWDAFVSANTRFETWSGMRELALGQFFKKSLA
mgnify:CR=1 FL=1